MVATRKDGNKLVYSLATSAKPGLKKMPYISKPISLALAQVLRWSKADIDAVGSKVNFFLDDPSLDNMVKLQENQFPQVQVHGEEHIPKEGGYLVGIDHPTGATDGVIGVSKMYQMLGSEQILKVLATSEVQFIPFVSPVPVHKKSGSKMNVTAFYEDTVFPHIKEQDGVGLLFPSGRIQGPRNDEDIIKFTGNANHPELQVPLHEREVKEMRHSYRWIQAAKNMEVPVLPVHLDLEVPREIYKDVGRKGLIGHIKRIRAIVNMFNHDYGEINMHIRKPIYPDQLLDMCVGYGYKEGLSDIEYIAIYSKVTEDVRRYMLTGEL